ncbi:hypothetical protein DM01DRAFT_1303010 [Hesseltinella vesiculosa]|uniref:Uncharacterized protein n=1 Tax=Hesseltinella vesiculosa TaxID=101127 RepID=A0A1X2GLT4_9FUNG|nr:hypothetical protein DM01DRAFT_1303010 [Hesseltinella vesiculosa]
MAWVAFFALFAYWGFVWFLRHLFGRGSHTYTYGYPREDVSVPPVVAGSEAAAPAQPTPAGYRAWVQSPHNRLTRVSLLLGELVLLLLGALVLNTIGQGSTRIVMILCWVYFGFAVFWSIFEAAKESPIARFVFGLVCYAIVLAIGIMAFVNGFYTNYRR